LTCRRPLVARKGGLIVREGMTAHLLGKQSA
jgi:hypothetical protein